MCLETMLILLCTRPREAAVDHNVILFENVSVRRRSSHSFPGVVVPDVCHCLLSPLSIVVRGLPCVVFPFGMQGVCSVLRELSSQLTTLPDYVRQLYGSLLIKLAKKKLNHATMVAGTSSP
jgi:hypothetical protein